MSRSSIRVLFITIFLCSLTYAIQYNVNYILIVHANQTPQPPGVKITSHVQNQHVPIGTLSIMGVSTDNSTTNCDVYIILNEIKAYQKVHPTGSNTTGNYDYSTWNYTFVPEYATIHEGYNRMVSKITCIDHSSINNENLTKFNSLNVTGIRIEDNATNSEIDEPAPELSTNTTYTDLVQLQDLDSNNANADNTVLNHLQSTNTQNDKQDEEDDSDNNGADYSSSRDEVEEEEDDKDFIEELHDRVLDQVTEQLRESQVLIFPNEHLKIKYCNKVLDQSV